MKKKLKLLVIIPILFITGCSIKYNLRIDSNLVFKDNIVLYEDNKILSSYNTELKNVPKDKYSQYKNTEGFENYNLTDKYFENEKTGGRVEAIFKNVEEYKKSLVFKWLFEDIVVNKNNNIVSYQTIGYNTSVFDSELDFDYYMEDIELNIRFHNKVIEHNAQKYDEKTNTYTWILSSNMESGNVMFSVDQSKKRYDIIVQDFFNDHLITIIAISTIIFIIVVAGCVMYSKSQKLNKI